MSITRGQMAELQTYTYFIFYSIIFHLFSSMYFDIPSGIVYNKGTEKIPYTWHTLEKELDYEYLGGASTH